MVRFIAPFIGALVLSGLAGAAPARKRDSAIGEEVAVSAPDGIVRSDTAELSSQLASESGDLPQTTSFADSAASTIDPAALPTDTAGGVGGIATDGSVVGTGGEPIVASSTAIDTPLPSVVSSGSSGYNFPIYGSGSSSWMISYNSCVTQCMVRYPPPPTVITLPGGGSVSGGSVSGGSIESGSIASSGVSSGAASSGVASSGVVASSGSGTVHNVVVAPHKGVLRYVPFYVQAQPGDTIHFMWGAGPHTVTESSALTPCNHTIGGFQSGQRNASATFDLPVNSTDPVFFYCGVPSHCQKGMFGAVNPPMAPGANTSVGQMMPVWAAANPDIAQALNDTNTMAANATGGAATAGAAWGNQLDVAGIDPSVHAALAKDILFTRRVMAANPDSFDANGKFNPTGKMTIPADISNLLDAADQGGNGGVVNAAGATTTGSGTASATDSASTAAKTGAALSVRSSGFAVAAVAVVAAFFAL